MSTKSFAQAFDTICTSSQVKVYRVMPTPGSVYFWSVEGGRIISPDIHADSIKVSWCSKPGTYEVKVIEQNSLGCWGDTAITSVVVNPKMQLNISGLTELCVGQPVLLSASGASAYRWSTGETASQITVNLHDTFNQI